MTGNEQRFLHEIATRIPLSSIVEVHMFAPIRHGAMETGVAVIATTPSVAVAQADVESTGAEPVGDEPAVAGDGLSNGEPAAPASDSAAGNAAQGVRYAVHTARYRHTLKGAERGRWEFDIAVEADAPLPAVDRVIDGVILRSGEQNEPVRLTANDIRASIGDVDCTATT